MSITILYFEIHNFLGSTPDKDMNVQDSGHSQLMLWDGLQITWSEYIDYNH